MRGGLEDWAYGAGWDYSSVGGSSTIFECKPYTYKLENVDMGKEEY